MTLKSHLNGGGLYVHVPFCRTKCRYCSFYSEPIAKHDEIDVIRAMLTQMQQYKIPDSIKTIYIGGGSPSCIAESNLLELVTAAKEHCPKAKEFTEKILHYLCKQACAFMLVLRYCCATVTLHESFNGSY